MKKEHSPISVLLFIGFAAAFTAAGWFAGAHTAGGAKTGAAESNERKIKYYQCSMDPQITSDKPDKCTICGMALAPVYEGGASTGTDNDGLVKLAPGTADVISVAASPVLTAPIHKTLRVAGVIVDDETKHRVLSARVPGRIENLYVNQVGIEVVKDQPLAEFYSPDVLTAQRQYLEKVRAGERGAFTASEIADDREKLLGFGLVEEDIRKLEQTRKPEPMFTLRAPFDGTVTSRRAYEGQYVGVNDELFEIGNFSTLWFVFDAYERDLPVLRYNQSVDVTFSSLPNETLTAPIAFIDPNVNPVSRTARVRVVLPNPNRRILNNQTANGIVHIETPPVLSVPRSALLYTHRKPVVYVETAPGAYQLRQVKLGIVGDDTAEVQVGVKEYERVVTQAALLIDSQSQMMRIAGDELTTENEKQKMENGSNLSPSLANTPLDEEFIDAVCKITSALSSDDLPEYQKNLSAVKGLVKQLPEEVQKVLLPLVEKLVEGKTLQEARAPFEIFSNTVADVVRLQPKEKRQTFIFQCPMSPVLGTARWIQKNNAELLNPFFGSEMLNCGSELQ
ncbi:hypothetical protein FACS189419_03150 [Planctomycetales bacterium]|nr:hypothetical protein FACS189419_03150 [Planctomycetales bacterium]